jgi:hypothetical protein
MKSCGKKMGTLSRIAMGSAPCIYSGDGRFILRREHERKAVPVIPSLRFLCG